ncbi:uncharacterized protein DUF998 [Asanoa ferruginea]|uniref:Uncharacterized protein DUF998 n=1 Tax=Asanoa ferruginea TaxID=53367 RepID=A0A3D9ZI46_9ACTN|nr:DUF998 domain-containing protein [Asanoa ferruginea]REF96132.1 uncharacterized protein DUF998 [Asanoa ferruginea]GIF49275.1 hypothetical protein Afe04nite_38140 [Asanoa ferruginea]
MNKTAARAFASVSILGLLTAVVATVIGHIGLGPGYDPLKLTISDYALSNRGVTIEIAMVALALGAPALLAGLRAVGVAIRGLPAVLLSIWSVGLLVAAIIPTDPPEVTTMSTAALVHRYTSVAAFVALPIAAAVIASRFPGMGRRMVSAVRRLCVGCALGVAVLWYVAFPGGRVMMGLVERSLVSVEIAILMVLSFGILRAARAARAAQPATREPITPMPETATATAGRTAATTTTVIAGRAATTTTTSTAMRSGTTTSGDRGRTAARTTTAAGRTGATSTTAASSGRTGATDWATADRAGAAADGQRRSDRDLVGAVSGAAQRGSRDA